MPRRKVLSEEDLASLLALPTSEEDLTRHWTVGDDDIGLIKQRRGDENRLGFGIQLCAYRYPGRLLRSGEVIGHDTIAFVGDQLGIEVGALANYAARQQTRRDQLGDLRDAYGYQTFTPEIRREVAAWLLPIALATTDGFRVATMFLDELRTRRVLLPGATVIERIVAASMFGAERNVARQLTAGYPLTSSPVSTRCFQSVTVHGCRQSPGRGSRLAHQGTAQSIVYSNNARTCYRCDSIRR